MEIFKDIIGYEGIYQISNMGRVKSLEKTVTSGKGVCINSERILKAFYTKKGYVHVRLYKNKVPKDFSVQRIVASHFIPNPENKPQVNHKNGVKDDNRTVNLEWATGSENVRHAWAAGINTSIRGSANTRSKLTEEKVIDIRNKYAAGGVKMRDMAKEYFVDFALIQRVIRHKVWTHVK